MAARCNHPPPSRVPTWAFHGRRALGVIHKPGGFTRLGAHYPSMDTQINPAPDIAEPPARASDAARVAPVPQVWGSSCRG